MTYDYIDRLIDYASQGHDLGAILEALKELSAIKPYSIGEGQFLGQLMTEAEQVKEEILFHLADGGIEFTYSHLQPEDVDKRDYMRALANAGKLRLCPICFRSRCYGSRKAHGHKGHRQTLSDHRRQS